MRSPIPVNIVTGFLGAGKTTAIRALLEGKPDDERWAVLVNEFGQVGIDQAAFAPREGVYIRELPGGCLCCTLGAPLNVALVALIRNARPDRLIIEPTGIGHPAGIIDALQSEAFKGVLELRATLCLVDPRVLEQPEVLANDSFRDQLNLADTVVVNKADLAGEPLTRRMAEHAAGLFPPKAAVVVGVQGRFDPDLLERLGSGYQAQYPEAHNTTHPSHDHAGPAGPTPEQAVRLSGSSLGRFSCSWVFHRQVRFDLDRLSYWCRELRGVERLKGAVRVGDRWVLINQTATEQVVSPLAWRRDSRIEMIAVQPLDAEALERGLLACREAPSTETR